jgi:Family of unknown function (DUF6152)
VKLRHAAALAAVIASFVLVPLASAHHSTASFEWGKERALTGTVERYEWTQPHTFIWLFVDQGKGKVLEWGLEGMSPSWLGRRGWSRHTLSAGDRISIVYYPLRDHRPGGFYVRVSLPDGRTMAALPQRGR